LSLIRQKFLTTRSKDGTDETPFGIELLYEGAKDAVFRRINDIAGAARQEAVRKFSDETPLEELARKARLRIDSDALLSTQVRTELLAWIVTVLKDVDPSETDKKDALATFILYGDSSRKR
jgi:hypothetical protein